MAATLQHLLNEAMNAAKFDNGITCTQLSIEELRAEYKKLSDDYGKERVVNSLVHGATIFDVFEPDAGFFIIFVISPDRITEVTIDDMGLGEAVAVRWGVRQ